MNHSNIDMIKLMPGFMRKDKAVRALSDICSELLKRELQNVDAQTVHGYESKLSEAQCDELAWERDIDWYDYSADLEGKRNAVKTARKTKRKMGTKKAIEEIIQQLYGGGKVTEWFEYGGQPYHFRVEIYEAKEDREESFFRKKIEMIVNARSIMDEMATASVEINHTKAVAIWQDDAIMDFKEVR